jgi:hypothetical protein
MTLRIGDRVTFTPAARDLFPEARGHGVLTVEAVWLYGNVGLSNGRLWNRAWLEKVE